MRLDVVRRMRLERISSLRIQDVRRADDAGVRRWRHRDRRAERLGQIESRRRVPLGARRDVERACARRNSKTSSLQGTIRANRSAWPKSRSLRQLRSPAADRVRGSRDHAPRLSRGESEYFINQTPVRLRDVVDLLMGTGLGPGSYAIVSQGQIDAILTSKPADRRALFEETAGISKFLARKQESMRRLERTEQNAIRISDLSPNSSGAFPELDTTGAPREALSQASERACAIWRYSRISARRRVAPGRTRAAARGAGARRGSCAPRPRRKRPRSGRTPPELRTQLYR